MSYQVLSKYRTELMGAAALWVMLFHAQDLSLGIPPLDRLRALGFGGVDIFILLSAMGLVLSLSRREQDYSAFMRRRSSRILPVYYLVMVPYTLFLIFSGQAVWSTLFWNACLLYYWVQPVGGFNWYVTGAMTFYAVTPMCFRRMRRSRHRELLTAAGVLAGLMICQVLMQDDYWTLDVLYRVPVFFMGLLMGFYVLEDRKLGWKDILFWWGWSGLGAIYYLAIDRVNLGIFLPTCHLFVFTTVPLCLAACWCFEHLPLDWLRRGLRLPGRYSLELYLLGVSLATLQLLRKVFTFGPSNRLYYLITFCADILLAVLLHKLVEWMRQVWSKHKKAHETA